MRQYRLCVLVVLILVLAACGRTDTPPVDPGPVRTLAGTVANWEGEEADLSVVVVGEDPNEVSDALATGTLAADGSFELVLPETLAAGFLTDSSVTEVCDGDFDGTITPDTWREAFADVRVTQEGEELGYLFLASSEAAAGFMGAAEGDFVVSRLYVDRDVTLQGTCVSPFGDVEFAGDLSEGWNLLTLTVLEVSEEGFPVRMRGESVAAVPAGAQWYFLASDDTPPVEPETVASGLNGPMGVLVDDEGTLWVIDSGVGGDEEFIINDPVEGEIAVSLGESARVVRVTEDGTQTDVAALYSALTPHGASGGNRLALLGGVLYATVGEWHEDFDGERFENYGAIVRIGDGEVTEVANTWDIELEENPDGREVYSHPYDLVAGPEGLLYVTDAGSNSVLVVDPDTGEVSVLVTFEPVALPIPDSEPLEAVPTGITLGSDGNLYVSFFHGGVSQVTLAGEVSNFAPGFAFTDIATGPDGELYAVQIFDLGEMGPVPASGKVYRVHEGSLELIIDGLSFPSSVAFNAAGDAFVAVNVLGAPGSGAVLRYPLATEYEGE